MEGLWRDQTGDYMECVYPLFVRRGTFADPLRWTELLAFGGDKNAGDLPLTAREVLSGLYMKTAGTRNQEPMHLAGYDKKIVEADVTHTYFRSGHCDVNMINI